jgi:hypothetical protein
MIQDVPDSQNINPSMIQNNQNNQFLSQVNDPGLIDVTQKIIQVSKEKDLEEEEKKADEEEAREQEEGPKKSILSKSMIQRRLNFKKLNEEFKNIFNKDNSNINDIRRCLIHVIILVGVMNCCVWEVDCLFFNICYGENIEMDQRISALLFPLIILSIFILYILFVSINYLQRKIIMTCIIIYILLSIVLFIIGILSIVKGVKFNSEDEENAYETLTQFEKDYYDEKGLRKEYRRKMLASGIMNIVLSVFGFFVSFKTFLFKSLLTKTSFDWRPPLRSHVRAQRIKKTVQLYTNNYDSYLYKFQAENPNYQIDEVEAKENKNRFGGIKNSILNKSRAGGESEKKDKKEKESEKSSDIPLPKKKKKSEKSENSNDNNDEDDIPLPRLKKKKKVLLNRIGEQNNEKDKHEENNNKSDEEHSNNINNNNHVNNNHIIEEEINTDIKKDIKEDDI